MQRVRLVRVAQPGRTRTLAVLEPATRTRYVELVAGVAEAVEASLGPSVVANRVAFATVRPPELRLRPWRLERRIFAARLAELAARSTTLVFADVRSCYASIRPAVVGEGLRRLGVRTGPSIERFLDDLETEGIRGLPVGPKASAVLANLALAEVDRALERANAEHLRWVDDLVIASVEPRTALAVVRDALATLGLEPNPDKTRIVSMPLRGRTAVSGIPLEPERSSGLD